MLPLSKEAHVAQECWAASPRTGVLNRAFDIFFAAIGLCFLSPLFCAIALAIKSDDGGPVFYMQVRVGRGFKRFRICKFRSMISGADRLGFLTALGDARLTRVGRFLRRYKLDELPQLLNVLRGDMQFVGPRPEIEHYVERFRSQYAVLLQDRPGITDPASLAYRHEDRIFSVSRMEEQYVEEILPAKLKLSLDYQKQRNLFSDAGILLQTALGLFV